MLALHNLNSIADYFVICSGESDRQLKAILDAIDETLPLGEVEVVVRQGDQVEQDHVGALGG